MAEQYIASNNRIAKNTIMLYFRMIFMMGVSLFTSRVVLQTLGVNDYGIYNVVGGFVSLFGFFNGAISSTTSRYITFALERDEKNQLQKVFSTCFLTHALIAIVVLILAETVGLWFVFHKLVIPIERMTAAMWVYQCSVVSTVFFIMSVPYNADIIAHEKMSAFAYISILEVVAKLIIVYLLYIGNEDKLIMYAILILVIQILVQQVYRSYCKKHFEESVFCFLWDAKLFREILSFAGWNLWGCTAGALFTTGLNVLLNMFFGPTVNAARGIAVQVQSAISQFSQNFQMALNPQITKRFAAGEMEQMHTLIARSSKFTFIVLLCLSLPVMMETDIILQLWLGQVPKYTVVFIRLMLGIAIVDAVANPLMVGASASGKIKLYQSIVGGILISIVPISYVVLKFGGNPESVFTVHLAVAIVAFAARLFIIKPLIKLPILAYVTKAVLPCLIIGVLSSLVAISCRVILPTGLIYSLVGILLTVIAVLTVSILFGLTTGEKKFLLQKAYATINKLTND